MLRNQHLNITNTIPLPSPCKFKQELPSTVIQRQFIWETREQIRKIINGEDPRLLLIVGPCSIHDIAAAKEYAINLHHLAKLVSDTFLVVMRTYFEKPRTTIGWKGMLYDPFLNGSHDIATGLQWARELLLTLADLKIPAATEFLDLLSPYYFGDLISWGCIGARTAASQTHRQMASGLPMPVAFKNSTDGNIDIAISGMLNASFPHAFIGINEDGCVSAIQTTGNTHCHLVLRGGESSPNYDPETIEKTIVKLKQGNHAQRLLIDCSHGNSTRKQELQLKVFKSIIHQVLEGNKNICGILLESHLFSGHQTLTSDLSQLKYAVSLTDPCMDWETTERLVLWGKSMLNGVHLNSKRENERFVSRSVIGLNI